MTPWKDISSAPKEWRFDLYDPLEVFAAKAREFNAAFKDLPTSEHHLIRAKTDGRHLTIWLPPPPETA